VQPTELHRNELQRLIGRKLTHIIHGARREGNPASSVYFFFEGGLCCELFTDSEPISMAKNVGPEAVEVIVSMFEKGGMKVFAVDAGDTKATR
jgi:hypothetical protein